MTRRSLELAARGGALALAALLAGACARSPEELAAEQKAVISRYCTECHSAAEQEAELVLENADLAHAAAKPAVWEKVIHKLDVGLMPPPGEPRPDAKTAASLVGYLETALDSAAAQAPKPGRQPLHRLNRASTAMRSATCSDSRSTSTRCCRPTARATASTTSRTCSRLRRCCSSVISPSACASPRRPSATRRWSRALRSTSPKPICRRTAGSRGCRSARAAASSIEHYFPTDAEYEFRPELWEAAASTVRGLEGFTTPFEFEMLLDGVPVHRAQLGGRDDDALSNRDQGSATASAQERIRVRMPVSAGMHRLGFTFVMKSFAIEQRVLQPFKSDLPQATTPMVGRGSRAC